MTQRVWLASTAASRCSPTYKIEWNRMIRKGCAHLVDAVIILLSAGFLHSGFAVESAYRTLRHDLERQKRDLKQQGQRGEYEDRSERTVGTMRGMLLWRSIKRGEQG